MNKSQMRVIAQGIVSEMRAKPYDYWVNQEYPITFEEMHHNQEVQVEIQILEKEEDYVHLCISVSGSFWTSFFPVVVGLIVRKHCA